MRIVQERVWNTGNKLKGGLEELKWQIGKCGSLDPTNGRDPLSSTSLEESRENVENSEHRSLAICGGRDLKQSRLSNGKWIREGGIPEGGLS